TDNYFDQQIKELEGTTAKPDVHARDQGLLPQQEEAASGNFGDEPPLPPGLHYRGRALQGANEVSSAASTPGATPTVSRPSTPGGSNLVVGKAGPGGKMSRRARKVQNAASSAPVSSGDEASRPRLEPPLPPGLHYRGRALQGANEVSSAASTPGATPTVSRPSTPGGSNLVVGKAGPGGKMSRRARKVQNAASSAPVSSGDEASRPRLKTNKSAKKGRKWDDDGMADEDDGVQLDYSTAARSITSDSDAEPATARSTAVEQIESSTWGSTTSKGQFVLKDLDDEVHSILASAQSKANAEKAAAPSNGLLGSSLNTITGLFRNVVGGKTLTQDDLNKAMKGMEEHLLKKNLDYSTAAKSIASDSDAEPATARSTAVEQIESSTWGSTTSKGQFVLKDLDDEVHSILASAQSKANAEKATAPSNGLLGSSLNTITGLFRNVVGGKTLTQDDLNKAMKGMEEHLLKKNVAREAAYLPG
ncbi:hypothetical protein BN1723_014088, partial [Verticillium longisporum]